MSPKPAAREVATAPTAIGRRAPEGFGSELTGLPRTHGRKLTVGPASVAQLRAARASRVLAQAYRNRIQLPAAPGDCHVWTGARAGSGHGWFWIGSGRVVLAHRFGYALSHGVEALLDAAELGHACGNPLCQNLDHIAPATAALGRARAVAVREVAARDGQRVASAITAGVSSLRRLR